MQKRITSASIRSLSLTGTAINRRPIMLVVSGIKNHIKAINLFLPRHNCQCQPGTWANTRTLPHQLSVASEISLLLINTLPFAFFTRHIILMHSKPYRSVPPHKGSSLCISITTRSPLTTRSIGTLNP